MIQLHTYIHKYPFSYFFHYSLSQDIEYSFSLVAQTVKNPPAKWETWVRSLAWEDSLEKGRLPTPVFWPGEFHGHRSLAGYSHDVAKSQTRLRDFHFVARGLFFDWLESDMTELN